jgi:hypothetical protein
MMRLAIVCLLLVGCSHAEPPTHNPTPFLPGPYHTECIDGELWAVNGHGRVNLGGCPIAVE